MMAFIQNAAYFHIFSLPQGFQRFIEHPLASFIFTTPFIFATPFIFSQFYRYFNCLLQLTSFLFYLSPSITMNHPQNYKPVYYLQRTFSPKNITNNATTSSKNISVLSMSIGANQSSETFLARQNTSPQNKTPEINVNQNLRSQKLQIDFKNLSRENALLKQQNQNLKKQLYKCKKQSSSSNQLSKVHERYGSPSTENTNDLRGTIKKEVGELRELRLKLEMSSKQIKIYEELIDKMDDRVKKLTQDNNKKSHQIEELKGEMGKIEQLKEKVNSIMKDYSEVEKKMHAEQLEWIIWKEEWLTEKEYYLNRIKELERLLEKIRIAKSA